MGDAPDVQIQLKTGPASAWIDVRMKAVREMRTSFQSQFSADELTAMREESRAREQSEEGTAWAIEEEKKSWSHHRDGYPIADRSVAGFYGSSRCDGRFRVVWGKEPGNSVDSWRVATFNFDQPVWTAEVNFKILDAWIAESSGDFVCKIEIPNPPDFKESDQRDLHLVFSGADGQVREHFQLLKNAESFLGISEDGMRYAWSKGDRVSISEFGNPEALYAWKRPGHDFPNCARFKSSETKLRLHSRGGTVLELNWEDQSPGRLGQLKKELERGNAERQLRLLQEEWVMSPPKEHCEILLGFLDAIRLEELRAESWYGDGRPEALLLRMEILQKLGRCEEANAASEALKAWRKPVDCAQAAVPRVKSCIESRDAGGLDLLECDIRESLISERLCDDNFALANLHRALGHLEEDRGQISQAIKHYEEAIGLNENVGCKRDLNRLRKSEGK